MADRTWWNPSTWIQNKQKSLPKDPPIETVVSPGRVSVPDTSEDFLGYLKSMKVLVKPSYHESLIPLLRDLYKVNPDMSITVQDMFKLANTGHKVNFPDVSEDQASKMRDHLEKASKNWSSYTAGINGLINKFITQLLINGAISIEAVPNKDLTGIDNIVFVKVEQIRFQRDKNGKYQPYQINPYPFGNKEKEPYIKLNTNTYIYVGLYNDTDEPYSVLPFMASLDSFKTQHDMRINLKNIMEIMGMVGFLEAKMEKPSKQANESDAAYRNRLTQILRKLKVNIKEGLKDGVIVGYKDDHEFNLNSTSQSLQNVDKTWDMNQQSIANGLGVSGNIIGVSSANTEGGAGIMLSKMISQLKNIQLFVSYVLEFIYTLELRLAGFDFHSVKVTFSTSTISDELKVQQGLEYKIRNLVALYNQGIISQEEFAWEMGYTSPDEKEPRAPVDDTGTIGDSAQKQKREADKDTSDRKTRDKNKTNPKRKDQDPRPR